MPAPELPRHESRVNGGWTEAYIVATDGLRKVFKDIKDRPGVLSVRFEFTPEGEEAPDA